MEEVRIRRSRAAALAALGIGSACSAALLVLDFLRTPFVVFAVVMVFLVGLAALIDRRVQLSFSEAGIRYSGWGPAVVPWNEFTSFGWASWRGLPYLQLFPLRPTELAAGFSAVGKLNHYCAGLLRIPPFSIAASQLDVSDSALTELTARYLLERHAG